MRVGAGTGFCGAFTTFSTFTFETIRYPPVFEPPDISGPDLVAVAQAVATLPD